MRTWESQTERESGCVGTEEKDREWERERDIERGLIQVGKKWKKDGK